MLHWGEVHTNFATVLANSNQPSTVRTQSDNYTVWRKKNACF